MAQKRTKSRVKKKFNASNEIRSIARERVGTVKASRVIAPKAERKPKHKTDPESEYESEYES